MGAAALWVGLVWAGVFAAGAALGAERDVVMWLVGPELLPRRVTLLALDEKAITYSGADRAIQNEPLAQHLQLRALGTPPGEAMILARADMVAVRLTDGQVLAGSWVGSAAGREGQVFKLRHPTLGEFEVDLEATAQIAWGGSLPVGPTPSADRVELVNGDTMSGFVAGLGEAGLELQPAGQAKPITLPRDRVRRLHLANPMNAQPPAQALLAFHDGVRVRASAFRVDLTDTGGANGSNGGAKLRFTAGVWGEERVLPLGSLQRIEASSAAGRLVELAEQEMKAKGADVFGVELPPILGPTGLMLHAPAVVSFTLPAGAERLSLVGELVAAQGLEATSGGPAVSSPWAHCELVLLAGGEELVRREVSAARPTFTVQAPVKAGPLEIRLEAGLNGPIQDRVLLRDAVVLVKP